MASKKTYNAIDWKEQLVSIEFKKGEFRGFKQDLLEISLSELESEYYVCTRCEGLMRNACSIGEEQTPVCQTCTRQGENPQIMAKSRKKIPELRARCPLERRDCVWKGNIREVEAHLDECPEFLVYCNNSCSEILKRSELANHCKTECECREIKCHYCSIAILFK